MRQRQIEVDTASRQVVDITDEVESVAVDGGGDGLLSIFAQHATCGLALMETGSGSEPDLIAALERVLPRDAGYQHSHGSPGHGADHLLPALVSPSLVVPVRDGRLQLGTWQRVVLVDLNRDNPRRHVLVSLLPG
jgi:secondary thiamine-phosphate synthase enzyme